MKTILHIITLSEIGGAQKVVHQLLKGLLQNNRIILACAPDGELIEEANLLGVKTYPLHNMSRSISPIKDIKVLKELVRIIKKENPDIVHCHSWKAGVLGRLGAFLCGTPKIYFTVHGWSKLHSPKHLVSKTYWLIEKLLAGITDKLICVCDADIEVGIDFRIAAPQKFIRIYNAVEEMNSRCNTTDASRRIPSGDKDIVIGSVGRLASQKRVMETLEVMEKLLKKYSNLYFVWVGDGPMYSQLEAAIRKKKIENRFILAGNQQNVYQYLEQMDIFLLLSNYEGLSISILEAMSIGLPVIASDVGGVREQVLHNVTGYIVDNDMDNIIQYIECLIEDNQKRKSFGEAAKDLFASKFTADIMIEEYKKLYDLE